MPSTHSKLYYHLVFSTKDRRGWIKETWEDRLHSYFGGILLGLKGVADILVLPPFQGYRRSGSFPGAASRVAGLAPGCTLPAPPGQCNHLI